MKKFIPILASVVIVLVSFYVVSTEKNKKHVFNLKQLNQNSVLGNFDRQKSCSKPPQFLAGLKIPQPVLIDLSQKQYKGIAVHYGEGYSKTLNPIEWQKYQYFSSYVLDEVGNIYLVPTPFISIQENTFELQENIYKIDSKTGKLSVFMHLDDVHSSPNNPYGISSIAFDCEDKTLWVGAIDESDYDSQKGVIYHIDPKSKRVMQRIKGLDALSMIVLTTIKGKQLLVGSARDSGLYAFNILAGKLAEKPMKILELPLANEHIRKIKITGKNRLELQSIPFGYNLIAQSEKKYRTFYQATWLKRKRSWKVGLKP